ncbi:MAG: KEOPS complex subunit Pcc1 [Thermoplasmata archaeon]|nr:KEOPS complex subunit Pcc1 [Thermoplasmata archaeon]
MNRAELKIRFDSRETAEIVARAIELENEGYVTMRVEDNEIVAVAEAENLLGLLHTFDDFLACAALAHKAKRI